MENIAFPPEERDKLPFRNTDVGICACLQNMGKVPSLLSSVLGYRRLLESFPFLCPLERQAEKTLG